MSDAQRIRDAQRNYETVVKYLHAAAMSLESLEHPTDEQKRVALQTGENMRAAETQRWALTGMVIKLDEEAHAHMIRVMQANRAAVVAENERAANERRISEGLAAKARIKADRAEAITQGAQQ